MRRVVWSDDAERDYSDILHYIASDDPDAAEKVVDAIARAGARLGGFATGHPGRVSGTYEKSVRRMPYVLAYALSEDGGTIVILRVIHGARDWRPEIWPA